MTKMKLIILTSFFTVLITFSSCNSNLLDREKIQWISFEWSGDSLGDKYFDKTAMFVPVSFTGIPHKFIAQFDLGSNASIIYGNPIRSYLSRYPDFAKQLDTTNAGFRIGEFKNIELSLDNYKTKLAIVPYYKDFGEDIHPDSINSTTKKHIGTIGVDILQDKILIIDYPNKRIAILDSINSDIKGEFDFISCQIKNGRIKLPLTINGSTQWYMFDTGSSIFAIITDENNWKSMCDLSQTDTIRISSWGEYYNVYGAKTNTNIYLDKIKLPETYAYMTPLEGYLGLFKQEGISGLTGNAYFVNNIIAIDFKNIRFGIYKSMDK
jgi:hypothetical protein